MGAMTLKEYMDGHEVAVRQLFDSLAYYRKLIKQSIPPGFTSDMVPLPVDAASEDIKKAFCGYCDEHPEFRKKQEEANKGSMVYKANVLAHVTICGSILQVAHMAIYIFSKYNGGCQVLTGNHKRFGIGRKVNSLPLGLIIYAGRNQYNHWWDQKPRKATQEIFDLIAIHNLKGGKDPAFNLEIKNLNISSNILGLIGWETYKDYEKDIIDMLSKFGD